MNISPEISLYLKIHGAQSLVKVTVEVPDNIMRFLEALSGFTGIPVQNMLSEHVDGLAEEILPQWPDKTLYASIEDLKKRYNLPDC